MPLPLERLAKRGFGIALGVTLAVSIKLMWRSMAASIICVDARLVNLAAKAVGARSDRRNLQAGTA